MFGAKWKLEDLPPHLRAQVERQLAKPQPRTEQRAKQTTQPSKHVPKTPRALGERVAKARGRKKMSHTEERFMDLFCVERGWRVLAYEPFSLWVSGGFRYTPDFLIQTKEGELVLVETKGSFRLRSHSRARLAFADASTRSPAFRFLWAKENRKHAGFSLEWWQAGKIIKARTIMSQGEKTDEKI